MSVELEEKYFDYSMQPGKKLNKILSLTNEKPLISIITGYYNCKYYIRETANSILNQTFPYWEWIIINDGSTEEGTTEILQEIGNMDKRIKIFNEPNRGRIGARDFAIAKTNCDLIFVIDSDDEIDRTMLECAYWTLMTNPNAMWAYSDLVNFDGQEFLWKKEFDFEKEKKENLMPVCSLIRKQALLDVGCYGVVDNDVHEDWHLWLRMLEKGYSPARMNFYGFWYRKKKEGGILDSINKDKKRDKHAKEEIKKQADKIRNVVESYQFPMSTKRNYDSYPKVFDWKYQPINIANEKIRLLFIFPWFRVGGADKFNFDLISRLDQNKFDITIVTTEPSDYIWRQKFEKYAEVFDLTSFLSRENWPGFIHYLIKSRNINIVMNSNSFFGFYIIPWLKYYYPQVVFTDYLHSENKSWRNGEYPRDSTAIDGFLDRTYTCTKVLRESMKYNMDRTIDNVKTVYIGVDDKIFDIEKIKPDSNEDLNKISDKLKGKKVILYLCRISEEKRPILMLKIFKKILEKDNNMILLVVGDGTELVEMIETAEKLKISENIEFMGMQENVNPFYLVSDVSVICSLVEGLTITTYESLILGTPVVTADVGGQKELVDNTCGRIVQNIQTAENGYFNRNYTQEEIDRYVNAIWEVLNDKTISNNCRQKVLNGYTVDNMVKTFTKDFEEFFKTGSMIEPKSVVNLDLYKQYFMLYSQIDIRNYYHSNGIDSIDYKIQMMKSKLWQNRIWRGSIKLAKKVKIDKFIEKIGIKKKAKNMVCKIIK